MATFTIERTGFLDCHTLIHEIFTDMEANGFIRKYPVAPLQPTDYKATFEAEPSIDPLAATQPWRIQLEALTDSKIVACVAGPLQLPDDGSRALENDGNEICGHIGLSDGTGGVNGVSAQLFFDRSSYQLAERAASPVNYRLTTTNNGIALAVWEPGNDKRGNNQSWFIVQRTVNNTNGAVRVTGKCPVACLYHIKNLGGEGQGVTGQPACDRFQRFTVREVDILHPTKSLSAVLDGPDSARVVNQATLVAITEDNNYVVSFPNSFNTQRYAYPVDEVDLIGYTSADVISASSQVSITVYGESGPRTYQALCASNIDNTGIRPLILIGKSA